MSRVDPAGPLPLLPGPLSAALAVSAETLGVEVARVRPDLTGTGPVLTSLLLALATGVYALTTHQGSVGGVVRLVTNGSEVFLRMELAEQRRALSVLAVGRAVVLTSDGRNVTQVFDEMVLNGGDAASAVACLARHEDTQALLRRVTWLLIREVELMGEGLGGPLAQTVALSELQTRESGVWRTRTAQGADVPLTLPTSHRA